MELLQSAYTRVFLIEDGAAPSHTPDYMGVARVAGSDFGQGTLTPLRKPSPEQYGKFDIVDIIRGAADLPTMTLENRMALEVSDILRIVNKGCALDIQVHMGECQNPEDFDGGWSLIRVLEQAYPTGYSTSELGALDADQQAAVLETLPLSGERMYDIAHIRPQELAASAVTDVVNRVLICDSATCGNCGVASDGCQVAFAITGPTTGSPGLQSEVLYTQDGGTTWAATNVTTLALGEEAVDAACIGTNLVIISSTGGTGKISYAPIADILDGSETWQSTTTGFVSNKTPNAIVTKGASLTWIAAEGGYVYFTTDPTTSVEVQHDGTLTTQGLNALHAYDSKNVVVVGDSNVVLQTVNGGETWTLITGPAVGVNLLCVWMQSASRWLVGTAGGELYYTENEGSTWTVKPFPGSGAGNVRAISFASRTVGYIVHDTATPAGRLLRTVNGGNSWKVLPDEAGQSVPSVLSLRSVAACEDNVNFALVGGTQTGGTDGYLARYA